MSKYSAPTHSVVVLTSSLESLCFSKWIVTALIEHWIWFEHCGSIFRLCRSKISFHQALDLIFKLVKAAVECTQDILRQTDYIDQLSEIPWVVPTFIVIEDEDRHGHKQFRLGSKGRSHDEGIFVDIIAEFYGPSLWKELSKETSSKILPCGDGSCWKTSSLSRLRSNSVTKSLTSSPDGSRWCRAMPATPSLHAKTMMLLRVRNHHGENRVCSVVFQVNKEGLHAYKLMVWKIRATCTLFNFQGEEGYSTLLSMVCVKYSAYEVVLFYNGLNVPTRQFLDSRGVIPSKTAVDVKVAIQEMAEYSQKWHNETSRTRSTKSSDGLVAIQEQLNNLGREIKKVNEKVYAAQLGCEECKGPHYTKDCLLKEEGKTLGEAYYIQLVHLFKEGDIEQLLWDSII
nr:hypothetical protein [Tanacetum cinerariifolium]